MKDKLIKVGYQGVLGSFGSQASMEYFGEETNYINKQYFEDIFIAIEKDEIDFGVLPIENTSTGAVLEVYDLLLKYPFYIVGERSLSVTHHVLGTKNTTMDSIKEIYSHPQAYSQSSEFFKGYKSIQFIPYENTATSAKHIAELKDDSKAAIASKKAAEIYNLKIIAEDINHNKRNITRFIIISKNEKSNADSNKISTVTHLPHTSGSLYKVLGFFAEHQLNLVKVESRPILDRPWEYFFIIDCEGNIQTNNAQEALKKVEDFSQYYRYLGNYKSHIITGDQND